MHDKRETLPVNTQVFYQKLLCFYPYSYRKRFGQEMFFVFQDIYKEELVRNGKITNRFWLMLLVDAFQGIFIQHLNMIKKQGIITYFHINKYNIFGTILLSPFLFLLGFDLIGRIAQGDLVHYNREYYNFISHTIIYQTYNGQAPLLWTLLVLFPAVAVLLNVVSIFSLIIKRRNKLTPVTLFFANPLAFIILLVGLFSLLIIFGHDILPCTLHGLIAHGLSNINKILIFCSKA